MFQSRSTGIQSCAANWLQLWRSHGGCDWHDKASLRHLGSVDQYSFVTDHKFLFSTGDAVNVASRMDSTGVPGRIQVRQECIDIFKDLYEFEFRGKVYVKGKDMMDVCLFKCKKEETLDLFQDQQLTI